MKNLSEVKYIIPKPIHSPHEGLGVVQEEFDEFKLEVYAFNMAKGRDTRPAMRKELIQLATMALRTVLDALEFDPTAPQEHVMEPKVPSRAYKGVDNGYAQP